MRRAFVLALSVSTPLAAAARADIVDKRCAVSAALKLPPVPGIAITRSVIEPLGDRQRSAREIAADAQGDPVKAREIAERYVKLDAAKLAEIRKAAWNTPVMTTVLTGIISGRTAAVEPNDRRRVILTTSAAGQTIDFVFDCVVTLEGLIETEALGIAE